jgi:hypothetical protein
VKARLALAAIAAFAAAMHAVAIAQTLVPAQDGLKFIRVAKSFRDAGPVAAIRATDQHPLYPAAICLAQPIAEAAGFRGPDSWRIAAQGVSAVASVACLVPLYLLGRRMAGATAGLLAALLFALLPIPMEIGHDTLSDPLALFLTLVAMERGLAWLDGNDGGAATACGLAAGLGYWTRPEAVLAGVTVVSARLMWSRRIGLPTPRRIASALVPLLLVVGTYGIVKGEASEKLALRLGVGLPPAQPPRAAIPSDRPIIPPKAEPDPVPVGVGPAAVELGRTWLRVTGVLIAPLVVFGAWLAPASAARTALRMYMLLFALLLVRHMTNLGYLSVRHVLAPVALGLPWAGWRLSRLLERLAGWLRLPLRGRRIALCLAVVAMSLGGIAAQHGPSHPSRWGHWSAGHWIASRAGVGQTLLDTRGWAAFISGRDGYGPWHFRQAEADPRLAFVVVERGELAAPTERARLLHRWLAGRASLAASFPDRPGGEPDAVRVYRWRAAAPGGTGS